MAKGGFGNAVLVLLRLDGLLVTVKINMHKLSASKVKLSKVIFFFHQMVITEKS